MPDRKTASPHGLEAASVESLARFSVNRDLAEEIIVQLGEAPFTKLKSAVLRLAEEESWPLTAALLKVARGIGSTDPTRETQLARLALMVAGRVHLPERAKRALFAEAETLVGDGCRRRGELREAEQAFVRAARHLKDVSDPHQRALYLSLLAHLREDQHRQEEALALRERAASLFGEIGQIDDQAGALLDKAALELSLADVESALTDLRTVLSLADRALRPDLAAIAVMGYGALLGEMRRTPEALAVIGAFREHYPNFGNHPALAEIDLLEGALLIFSDRREVAESRLEAARRAFLLSGQYVASGEACLNLALLFLLDGRREPDLMILVGESIEPLAQGQELPVELRASLSAFCVAVKNRTATAGLAGALRKDIRSRRDISEDKPSAAGLSRAPRGRHGHR